jgi:signal transduction histidine kinase/ActR/RegA family two-component response regulator
VRAEQVRTLYRQTAWIVAANPVNSAIVAAVVWAPGRTALCIGWVCAAALVAAARASLRRRYRRAQPPPAAAPLWARRYAIGAAASGLLWGAGSMLLYDPHAHASELFLAFVVGGMVAGAAGTLASHVPSFYAFAVPTLLPLAGRIAFQGDRIHLAMGALLVVYGLVLAFTAGNTSHALAEAFRLRFENEDLAARLAGAQASLEVANRSLEQRVAERGLALERKDEALREARRMESLGLLAGGVAHDFNNLLTVILGNAAVILAKNDLPEGTRGAVDEVRSAAERAAALVSQLLAFSRRQARRPRVLDLNTVVSDTQRLLARLIGDNIDLVVALPGSPLPVDADPGQLEQVIINLATNARDAMPAGGRLTIETEAVEVAAADPTLVPPLRPGPHVVLSVRDTGVGMDAETRRMVFDPFFTTKDVGHGIGLGLATVHGVVEQSGGHIFVDSEPGQGSTFRVYLPRAEPLASGAEARAAGAEAAELAPPAPPLATPGLAATVLLVEDERIVRSLVARALTRAGFTVIEAENGEQALERSRAYDGSIDLLVTDVVMSRMSGPDLAKKLMSDRPGIRVLFVSGFSRNAVLPAVSAAEGIDFLQKPFTPDDVIDRIARLIAGAPPPGGPGPGPAVKARSATAGGSRR